MQRIDGPQELGAAVRAARKAQGLRLEDLALAAGVGVRFLSEFERGKPSTQLAEAMRVVAAVGLELHVGERTR
jgi:HTH-type transcriptional regulator / antitoxin HipB